MQRRRRSARQGREGMEVGSDEYTGQLADKSRVQRQRHFKREREREREKERGRRGEREGEGGRGLPLLLHLEQAPSPPAIGGRTQGARPKTVNFLLVNFQLVNFC